MRPKHLIYGDFNSPVCYLLSARVGALNARGLITVEWRAVEHDRTFPRQGRSVSGLLASQLASEVDHATSRLAGRCVRVRLPAVLPNTARPTASFAACHGRDAVEVRRRLFAALWVDGRNIGTRSELDRVLRQPVRSSRAIAEHWRASWLGFDRPTVPLMMLPTGWVLRGLEALDYLAELEAREPFSVRRTRVTRAGRARDSGLLPGVPIEPRVPVEREVPVKEMTP